MLNKSRPTMALPTGRSLTDYSKFRTPKVSLRTKGKGRWIAAKLLRSEYLATLDEREILIDKWRDGHPLSKEQMQAVWLLLSDLVYSRSRQHFGQRQPYGESRNAPREWHDLPKAQHDKYDLHTERMLLLADWLRVHNIHSEKPRSAGWCIKSWKLRFTNFEAVRELRQKGVAVSLSEMQQSQVRVYILFKELRRSLERTTLDLNTETLVTAWRIQNPTASEKAIEKMRHWFDFFIYLHSYTTPISLDAYESRDSE